MKTELTWSEPRKNQVFLVRKKSTGKVYAMKTLLKEAVIANQQVERAKSERQILEVCDQVQKEKLLSAC